MVLCVCKSSFMTGTDVMIEVFVISRWIIHGPKLLRLFRVSISCFSLSLTLLPSSYLTLYHFSFKTYKEGESASVFLFFASVSFCLRQEHFLVTFWVSVRVKLARLRTRSHGSLGHLPNVSTEFPSTPHKLHLHFFIFYFHFHFYFFAVFPSGISFLFAI